MNRLSDSPPSPKQNSFEGFRPPPDPPPPPPPPPQIVSGNDETREKPKKKRSKVLRIGDSAPSGSSQALRTGDPTTLSGPSQATGSSKPKSSKKPEPNAPKITRPCSECGKQFWSWKALFGHMRCHPERQWRGINPPPNFQRNVSNTVDQHGLGLGVLMTEEDHEVATCLLMLANGSISMETQFIRCDHHGSPEPVDSVNGEPSAANDADMEGPSGSGMGWGMGLGSGSRFECSSCKKVFGSHQALGGHRASHKNVKGCFAIAASNDDDGNNEDRNYENDDNDNGNDGKSREIGEVKMGMELGHKCGICLRVFSSGQALGGHKRCHWEKGEDSSLLQQGFSPGCSTSGRGGGGYVLDLNLPPAPVDENSSSSSSSTSSSDHGLDLRLGF